MMRPCRLTDGYHLIDPSVSLHGRGVFSVPLPENWQFLTLTQISTASTTRSALVEGVITGLESSAFLTVEIPTTSVTMQIVVTSCYNSTEITCKLLKNVSLLRPPSNVAFAGCFLHFNP